jgi:hypothetical protein
MAELMIENLVDRIEAFLADELTKRGVGTGGAAMHVRWFRRENGQQVPHGEAIPIPDCREDREELRLWASALADEAPYGGILHTVNEDGEKID